jgi:hypothetical protein
MPMTFQELFLIFHRNFLKISSNECKLISIFLAVTIIKSKFYLLKIKITINLILFSLKLLKSWDKIL